MACYALLGRTDWSYERIEVAAGGLRGFLSEVDASWVGLSLTMPLKEEALRLMERLEPSAARIGAINTVVFRPNGVTGFNTDQIGFREVLHPHAATDGRAAVVGTGATARSALSALVESQPSDVVVIGRDPLKFLTLLERFPELPLRWLDWPTLQNPALHVDAPVVINTAPRGVKLPVAPYEGQYLVDVNYPNSDVLELWRAAGGAGEDGTTLLVHQGVMQVLLFMGEMLSQDTVNDLVKVATAAVQAAL